MVHNLWFNKHKFYYGTGKKLRCTSLIHNIKVQVARYLKIMYFSQNRGTHKQQGHMNSSPQSPLIHPFTHSLTQLPLPSTELCRRNVEMIKAWSGRPPRSIQFIHREKPTLRNPSNETHVLTGMCAHRTGETRGCLD